MGSITRTSRGQRFIEAFGADLIPKLAPPGLGARCTLALDASEEVRLFTTVQDVFGHSHDVLFDSIAVPFDPETDFERDTREFLQLVKALDVSEEAVETRLRSANLWNE